MLMTRLAMSVYDHAPGLCISCVLGVHDRDPIAPVLSILMLSQHNVMGPCSMVVFV